MKNITRYDVVRSMIYLVTIMYVILVGPVIEPDSNSYLHLTMIASPGYASFLYGFKKILGVYAFHSVVVVQLITNLITIYYFNRFLQKRFAISRFLVPVLDIILLVALWIPGLVIANKITSEALAYPLLLWVLLFFVEGIILKKQRYFVYAIGLLFIGLQVRTQFFFIIPVLILVLVYEVWKSKEYKKIGKYIVLIAVLPMLVSLVDKTFHYMVSDAFENTSNTGVQLITIPFFVSEKDDYKIFDDQETQEYFKYVYDYAVERKMLDDFYTPIYNDNVYHYFHDNYAVLSYGVLSVKGREFLYPDDPKGVDALVANNKLLIRMSLPLFIQNFRKSIPLFYYNIVHAFGGYYMLLLSVLILFCSLFLWFTTKWKIAFLSTVFMLLTFSNVLLVCMVEHSIDRFMLYHQWMLPILGVLLIDQVLKNASNGVNLR